MDTNQFDLLTRVMSIDRSRRGALAAVMGGALGLHPLSHAGAKKKKGKKGKNKCGRGKRRCGKACIPTENCCAQEECDTCARQICQNGRCECAVGLFPHNGVCGAFLNCLSVGEICTSDFACCSDKCNVQSDDGTLRCNRSTDNCITDFDCVSGPCRGFMCPELYQASVKAFGC